MISSVVDSPSILGTIHCWVVKDDAAGVIVDVVVGEVFGAVFGVVVHAVVGPVVGVIDTAHFSKHIIFI